MTTFAIERKIFNGTFIACMATFLSVTTWMVLTKQVDAVKYISLFGSTGAVTLTAKRSTAFIEKIAKIAKLTS